LKQIKNSGTVRWADHIESIEERRSACLVLVGKLERKRQLGSPGVDGRILLKLMFKKCNGGHGLD
jgi:hypothetical protein